jgi:beta-N-acetylhexosaminidase
MNAPRGPVVIGVEGLELTADDRARLAHPLVGGVILFARNYAEPGQLTALTTDIHASREPRLPIAVDHEGGRVQRFRAGFTAIPPMRALGESWDGDVVRAAHEAAALGATIGTELRAHGVDFSFTPVLDLDWGSSTVIGDRAFHADPNAVAHLASALRRGLRSAGMAAVGKHFPGHGHVAADSHHEIPVDERAAAAIFAKDLVPFAANVKDGLEGIMPAHVVYPQVDAQPAGYSRVWLQEILRGRLGFDGLVFSDDLDMAGAHGAGDMLARADAAIGAGCDVVLLCNDFAAMDALLSRWRPPPQPDLARRWARMTSAG